MRMCLLSSGKKIVGLFQVREGLLGLMVGECFLKRIELLLFVFPRKSRWGLHSFACVASLDCVFCDGRGVIVELVENWQPNGRYRAENAFRYLLEMPKGWIVRHTLKLGDKIKGIV